MKKNAMLKIAAILMVAVLLTTCAISSTFAKYTTSAEDSVTARVAKFGVEASITLDDLFKSSYTTGTDPDVLTTATHSEGDPAVQVVDKVVAPGTEGSLTVIGTISGKPEVAVKVSYVATLALENWKLADNSIYFPVVFTIGDDDYAFTGNTETALNDFIDDIEAAIADYSDVYAPETDLAGAVDAIPISWKWDFGDGTTDEDDTYFGDIAADDVEAAPSITLTIKQTIEQVDALPVQ